MIFILICLLCGFMIIRNNGQKRFDWFVCSALLLSSSITILKSPQIQAHRFFILCYWLSVVVHKEYRHNKFPLLIPLIIYGAGEMFIGWQDTLLTPFYRLWKPFAFLLDSYLIMLMAFWGTKNVRINSKPIINTLLIMTIYGIFTLVIRNNPLQQFIWSQFSDATYLTDYYFGDRIRITSTWSHPIAYGFVCSTFAVLLLKYLKNKKCRVAFILLVINVFICGSRTSLAALILMIVLYALLEYKFSKLTRLSILLVPALFLVYLVLPPVQEKIDSIVNTAMGNSDVGGSSVEMRQGQLEASLMIFASSPMYGHGPDYIQENMMSDKQLMNQYSMQGYDFEGFESYYYILLIERGIVGIVLEVMLVVSILMFLIRNRKRNKLRSSEAITIFLGFAFFALSTGALDTWMFTTFFVGLCMNRIKNGEGDLLTKKTK